MCPLWRDGDLGRCGMIATIYVLFLVFGMASCFAAIVVAAEDWVNRRHDRVYEEDA